MSKCVQISMFTEKGLWWRRFRYSCRYYCLQLYEKTIHHRCFLVKLARFCRTLRKLLDDCFWTTATSSAPLSGTSSATLRATLNAPSCVLLCRLLSTSLGAALSTLRCTLNCTDKWAINFLCSLKCSVKWNLDAPSSAAYCSSSISTFIELFCILLCIDNCMNKCNSSATSSALFSAFTDEFFCASLYISSMYKSSRIIRCTLNYIIKRTSNAFIVVPFVLSCASAGALKCSLLFSFSNWADFAFICTLKSIFESILKCIPYTLSFAISITFGGAICDFLV